MYYPNFNREVCRFLRDTGTSHAELARQVGMDDDALRAKRLGRRSLEVGEAMRICHIIKLPAEYLFCYARAKPAVPGDYPLRRGRSKKKGANHE